MKRVGMREREGWMKRGNERKREGVRERKTSLETER